MSEMLDLMMSELTVSRVEAMALASAQVSLRITQVVNPARGVHAFWPMG
jgi:acetamidase/formamidase